MPYKGMNPSLWGKMDRCVEKVMATGKEKPNAIAICRASIEKFVEKGCAEDFEVNIITTKDFIKSITNE